MAGGAGNDTYIVDAAGDVVTEGPNKGADLIKSAVTCVLAPNVEKLTLTGTGTINGTGNVLANAITGNSTANTLSGGANNDVLNGKGGNDVLRGGAGNDTLTGGVGQDKFDFNYALDAATNVDRITDFNAVDDVIRLDDDFFVGIGPAGKVLAATAFQSGTVNVAQDADVRVIYNSGTGKLFFDSDGAGGVTATYFATLTGAPAITAADFFIIA
jgi:Ca2+-binding RTX toxin-like protein